MIINCNETKHLWGKKHLPCISNVEKENKQLNLNIPKRACSGARSPAAEVEAAGSSLQGAVKPQAEADRADEHYRPQPGTVL